MNEVLPGIDSLETIGASLLALERRINLGPLPELALDTDTWQLFADPLNRLDALVPPLPASTDKSGDEAPVPGVQPLQVSPSVQQAGSLAGFAPGAPQSPDPVWRVLQPQTDPSQKPARQASGSPAGPTTRIGVEPLTPSAPFASPGLHTAPPPASLERSPAIPVPPAPVSETFRVNPLFAPRQESLPSQRSEELPRERSETRLASGVSGLSAILQANLKQSQPEPGRPFKPQAAALQPQTGAFTAPGISHSAGVEAPADPLPVQNPAAQPPELSFPAFLPAQLLPDQLSSQVGLNQTVPNPVPTRPNPDPAADLADNPSLGAPAGSDLFQAWLDDLELAYLRTYGTSGI